MHDDGNASEGTEQPNPTANMPTTGPHFSLRSLLIAVMVICVLLAVLVPSLRHMRRLAQQMKCRNNLKQIGLAFLFYFPFWVFSYLSWRLLRGV